MDKFISSIIFVLLHLSTATAKVGNYFVASQALLDESPQTYVSNFFLSSKVMSYSEASVFCTELGGKLLSIETREKDEQTETALIRNKLLSTPVWTSGMYEKASDAWVWSSSSSDVFSYTNWITPSQKSPNSTQCVYTVRERFGNKIKYGWNYNPCYEEYRFICEL